MSKSLLGLGADSSAMSAKASLRDVNKAGSEPGQIRYPNTVMIKPFKGQGNDGRYPLHHKYSFKIKPVHSWGWLSLTTILGPLAFSFTVWDGDPLTIVST